MKLRLLIELDYDAETMHGDSPESVRWFFEELLPGDDLFLHSNEIGDTVGTVKVVRVFDEEEDRRLYQLECLEDAQSY